MSAVLADDSRTKLQRRSSGGVSLDDGFHSLFAQEIASRFHLETRPERREVTGFVVRPANGTQLKARRSKSFEGGKLSRKGTPILNVYSTVDARGVALEDLCSWLERQLNAVVTSSDALPAGFWDFRLKWRSGDQSSLLQAVREQVGLDVVEGSAAVEYLIVSHVERPSFAGH